jgi:predicted transcriptional regulator
MSKSDELEHKKAASIIEDEDASTLASIDEGLRDAKAGRSIPLEKVREELHKWNTEPS